MQKKTRLLVFLGLFCFAVVLNATAKDDSYIEKIANEAGLELLKKTSGRNK